MNEPEPTGKPAEQPKPKRRRTKTILFVIGSTMLGWVQFWKLEGHEALHPFPEIQQQLDPKGFRVACWNVWKGAHPDFLGDWTRLNEESQPDILLVQEATQQTPPAPPGFGAQLAHAFRAPTRPITGVATFAKSAPQAITALTTDWDELGVLTPKTTLITSFSLGDQTLLVVNFHGLNTPLNWLFQRQLQQVVTNCEQHEGPMIWAGDFNSWSMARVELIEAACAQLNLAELQDFAPTRRRGDLGRFNRLAQPLGHDPKLVLDRLYFRDLTPQGTQVRDDLKGSDHTAFLADFRL